MRLKRVDSNIRLPKIGCSESTVMGGLQSNRKPSYDANGEGIGKKLVFFFCGSQNTIVELFIFSFQSILIISKYSVLLEKERLERYVRNARFAVEKFDLFQQGCV